MQKIILVFIVTSVVNIYADGFLGEHELGENISFMFLTADHSTGEPVESANPSFKILSDGSEIGSGPMYAAQLGVATGVFETSGLDTGMHTILMAGGVGDVTQQQVASFTLVATGAGPESFQSQFNALAGIVNAISREIRIVTRENTRSRLWYSESLIDSATRKVPADMPSHLEVQLSLNDIPEFATPEVVFYRVFFYPDSVTSTRATREEKWVVAPVDGAFYALPNNSW